MTIQRDEKMSNARWILESTCKQAITLGADVAGYISAETLIGCPSAVADGDLGLNTEQGSYIILGLYHPSDRPELDQWEPGRGTPGNTILGDIGRELSRWLDEEYGISARTIPYQLYEGGIYLKDAACMAGIGTMGRNNLVIVPGFGPRIRFRAVWIDLKTTDHGVVQARRHVDCQECREYCIQACPMDAFSTGTYSRNRCMERMNADKQSGTDAIDHCRICELVCPASDELRNSEE